MFNKTLLILLGVLTFGVVHAAPTSTIVQNLFITDLRGNGTKCLKILTNGLVQTSTADCGSGGSGATTTINGVDGPTFLFASTSPIDIVASGNTFTWSFTNPGFVTSTINISTTTIAEIFNVTSSGNKSFTITIPATHSEFYSPTTTIATDNIQLANGAGYVTSSITITTTTASGIWNVTSSGNKAFTITLPSNVSFFTNDAGYLTSASDTSGVATSGTPVANQLAIFFDGNTIFGSSSLTFASGTGLFETKIVSSTELRSPSGTIDIAHFTTRIGVNKLNTGSAAVDSKNNGTAPAFRAEATSTTSFAFGVFVTGGAQRTFNINGLGNLTWGDGAVAVDTTLARLSTSTLQVTNNLFALGMVSSTEHRTPSSTITNLIVTNASGTNVDLTGYLKINGDNVSTSTGANPSASVGLTAVNGSANTFMRSDGAPALSQSITPVWTGLHQFSGAGASTTQLWSASTSINFGDALVVATSGKKLIAYVGTDCGAGNYVQQLSATGTATCAADTASAGGGIVTSTPIVANGVGFFRSGFSSSSLVTMQGFSVNTSTAVVTLPSSTLDGITEIYPSVPDAGTATPTYSIINQPNIVISGLGNFSAYRDIPTISSDGTFSAYEVINAVGTINANTATPGAAYLFLSNMTHFASSTRPAPNGVSFEHRTQYVCSVGSCATSTVLTGFRDLSKVSSTAGGWFKASDYNAIILTPTVASDANSTSSITTRRGIQIGNITKSGTGANLITNNIGIDIGALAAANTLNVGIRSVITASSSHYFLQDTGGAASVFAGKVSIGTTTQATNALFVNGTGTITGLYDSQGNAFVTSTSGGTPTYIMGGFADSGGAADFYCSGDMNQCQALETNINDFRMPIACTAKNLHANIHTAPGAGGQLVITIRDAASDGALTCTISDPATSCSDTSNSEAIAQGAIVTWFVDDTGSANPADIGISYTCE